MIGRSILHYNVTAALGAGGMGQVWKARDTRLDRDVAIKALPDAFALDADRLARFEREARLLASLQHTHVGAIYGLEEVDGHRYLVLEFIDGRTLADHLARGPLPMDEALAVCAQIAAGVEAAHESGVIHRDLKPGNVMLRPDGVVKVLDFGLAKSAAGEVSSSSLNLSASPTMTAAATGAGVILGTAAYMSPEQARGKPVDRRTDIWSFGCVLYECLTGRRAFEGETVSDLVARILEREPEWAALPASTPVSVRRLLERCLTKNPRDRLRDIGEARIALERGANEPPAAPVTATPRSPARLAPWLVAAACLAALAVTLMRSSRTAAPAATPSMRMSVAMAEGESFPSGYGPAAVISPDGGMVAFIGGSGQDARLYLRRLDDLEAHPIDGARGVRSPFFSPDGQWIGFMGRGLIQKVPATGGTPARVCATQETRGAAWCEDGTIVVALNAEGALSRVSADGGEPVALTTLNAARNERSHRWPCALPGGAILFMAQARGQDYDEADIQVWDPATKTVRTVLAGGAAPTYSRSGHLLFARRGQLFAAPFDLKKLAVTGPSTMVLDGLLSYTGEQTSGDGSAEYSLASNGTLVYRQGGAERSTIRRAVWVDRAGNVTPALNDAADYVDPRVSPDGRQLAIASGLNTPPNIIVYDLVAGTSTRLTFSTDACVAPSWTPDSRTLVYSRATGAMSGGVVLARRADGSGEDQTLYEFDDYRWPCSIAPDGRTLVTDRLSTDTNWDVMTIPLSTGAGGRMQAGPAVPLLATPAIEWCPAISPDGKLLAYTSTESGSNEIYVQDFPGGGGKWLVSSGGGGWARWSGSGDELFYRSGAGVMSVKVRQVDGSWRFDPPVELFKDTFADLSPFSSWDVAPDGKRFLMIQSADTQRGDRGHLTFATNWLAELARVAPPKGKS
jgi:serine/threonine-protein kinase